MKTIQILARNYIAPIRSISGSGGHTSLLAAATALVMGYDLPEDSAMELLSEWNQTNAIPPWSDAELRHKLREAAKSGRPRGYLLANGKSSSFAASPSRSHLRQPDTPAVSEAAVKSARRQQWPTFRLGTEAELRAVASLRKIHPGVVWLAQKEGLLRFTTPSSGERCYVFTEGTLAQVRRMDGKPFANRDGTTIKSRNLPGSVGKWLGYGLLARRRHAPVLIVEGLVAWLEAAEAITASDFRQWIPFAALSAPMPLEARELALLAGREVIIARDRGVEGAIAAQNWQESLAEIGITAPIWTPPVETKDIGESLAIPSFDPNSIFNHLKP